MNGAHGRVGDTMCDQGQPKEALALVGNYFHDVLKKEKKGKAY